MKSPFLPNTEFTMDELVEQIIADESVSKSKRSTFASAANMLAKGSGVPLSAIPAHPDSVRRHLELLNASQLGVSRKSISNARSLLRWGLTHSGITSGRYHTTELLPQWVRLRDVLPDKYAKSGFSRFFRFCSVHEILPEQVDDAVSQAFLKALSLEPLVKKPPTLHQTMCRLWNRMADSIEIWPSKHLTVPRYFVSQTLEWADLPPLYRKDAEAYLSRLQKDDPLDLDLPAKPLKPVSVDKYRYMLRRCASILLRNGMKPDQVNSLSVIVELENAQTILKHFIPRELEKKKKSASGAEMAVLLKTIARQWVGCDADHIETIGKYATRLRPDADGVGQKNRERLAPLRDERTLATLLLMPGKLIKELAKKKVLNRKDALLFQKALALLILTVCPLRISNVVCIDLNRHIIWSELGMKGTATFNFSAGEVKNEQSLSFPLPDHVAKAIRLYIERFRPLLTTSNDGFLFPSTKLGSPKRPDTLSKQLSKLVKATLGLDVNPHLYRQIVHLIVLRQFPGAFEMVSRVLGHKSTQTALTNYGSEGIAIAMETYSELIRDKIAPTGMSKPSSKGEG